MKNDKNKEGNALIHNVVRSFFDAMSDGVAKLGQAVDKSGLIPVFLTFWCIGWGVLGVFITIELLLR